MLIFFLCVVLAYLVGSTPTAYLIGKWVKKIDIRQHGSGNVGASNVFRVVGKKWGFLVLGIDVIKGFLSSALIAKWGYSQSPIFSIPVYCLLVGLSAVAGHNWTFFLNFRGGKGVATSLGVVLVLLPKAALLALGVWILVLIPYGYIALSSMLAALSFPVWIYLLYRTIDDFAVIFVISLVLAVVIIYMHRTNIQRLRAGTENRVWKKNN